MVTVFKFNQYIKENKSLKKLKISTLEECNIKRKKYQSENFTPQEIIEIKKILNKDLNLKYNINKNKIDINYLSIAPQSAGILVEKLEDEWFITRVNSFNCIDNNYIIDGFDDIMELLKMFPFYFSILKLFNDCEIDENIDKSMIFHTLLDNKSSVYEKIKIILLVLNSKLLNDSDVLEILSTECKSITLLVGSINKIYKNNKDLITNLATCSDLLKNNS